MEHKSDESILEGLKTTYNDLEYPLKMRDAQAAWSKRLRSIQLEVRNALEGRVHFDGTADSLVQALESQLGAATFWVRCPAAQNAMRGEFTLEHVHPPEFRHIQDGLSLSGSETPS